MNFIRNIKCMLAIMCFFFLVGNVNAGGDISETIDVVPITFGSSKANSTAITTATTSNIIDLKILKPNGYFSLYVYVNDTDADVDIYYEISYTGATNDFRRPVDIYNVRVALIYDDFLEDGGANSDGKEIKPFEPVVAPYIRFVVDQGSLSNDVTAVTLELCNQ